MIVDLSRFIASNRAHWQELEAQVTRLENDPTRKLTVEEATRLHYLYERSAAALARIQSQSSEAGARQYLSALVGRAYALIYETRRRDSSFSFKRWLFHSFPATFREHRRAFLLAVVLTLAGCTFGAVAVAIDSGAKRVLMPFAALQGDPGERVKREESGKENASSAQHSRFSAQLMTHNTRVSILTFSLGVTGGIGSALALLYNGVILGAVAFDYIRSGHLVFLLGWLLPHGVVEIPAILIGGQAGFVLAGAIVGGGSRRRRLREARPALVTLAAGTAVMLVWAGLVEAFISQFHAPVLPYSAKIGFGLVELLLLVAWLSLGGRAKERP